MLTGILLPHSYVVSDVINLVTGVHIVAARSHKTVPETAEFLHRTVCI
jgi:hypothetical protein